MPAVRWEGGRWGDVCELHTVVLLSEAVGVPDEADHPRQLRVRSETWSDASSGTAGLASLLSAGDEDAVEWWPRERGRRASAASSPRAGVGWMEEAPGDSGCAWRRRERLRG